MKIAIVRQRYTAFGGAERFTDRALRALSDSGVEVTVIARRWRGEGGFPVRECRPFYLGRTWRDRSFRRCVCDLGGEFDLVQSHERIPCCDVYRAGDGLHREWLAQKHRVSGSLRRFAARFSPYDRYVLGAEAELFASPRLQAVICNSRMVRDEIKQHFGLPDERLPVLYNGVDTEQFHPRLRDAHRAALRVSLGVADNVPVMLFVGSGYFRKGVAAAIEAVRASGPHAQLWVVGKDRDEARYQRLAADLGERVRFFGPRDDVLPFYGAADALLLPTLYDPFPNVVLEAMASGLPVITSFKCGAVDILRDGDNGFLRDALDIAGLADCIRGLGTARAARMGEAARATVADWTLERVAEQARALYADLLAFS